MLPLLTAIYASALIPSLTGAFMLSVISSIEREASPSSLRWMRRLYSVLAVCVYVQRAAAAQRDVGAVLAFYYGGFRVLVFGCSSSLLYSVSVSVFSVPSEAVTVTSEDLPHTSGAVSSEVSSRPYRISVTPVVPFFIFIEPFAHFP